MKDKAKTKTYLLAEVAALRAQVAELEAVAGNKQAEAENQRRLAQLEALRQISLELTAELDLDTLLKSIVLHGMKLLEGSIGSIYLYRPELDVVELVLAVGNPLMPQGVILRRGEGMSGKILETHQPLLIENYQEWAGGVNSFKGYSLNTAIAVPIQLGQEFLGTLNIANRPTPFSMADIELLSLVATQAAIAIRNARLLDSLQLSEQSYKKLFAIERRQAQQLYLLERVRAALAGELDLPTILRKVVEVIAQTFGYSQVSIYLLEGEVAVLQHQVGYHQVKAHIPLTQGLCGQVVRTGEPLLIRNASPQPDFAGVSGEPASEICVPLFDQGQVVGFFNIQSSQEATLDEADLRLMIALSEQINLAISRARLYTEARESAERFRQLAENIQDVFWMTNLAGTETVYVSPAYETLWRRSLQSIYEQSRSWLEAVHPEDRTVVATLFVDRDRRKPALKEYRIVQPDGEIRWVRDRSFPVLNDLGEVYRVAGIIEDITERRQTEQALRQSEQRYRELAQQNAALYAESQKHLIEQTALLRATTVISSTLDLPTVLTSIAEQMGLAVDATSAYICSYDPETKSGGVMAEYLSPSASAEERVSDTGVIYYLPHDFPKTFAFLQSGQPAQLQHVDDLELREAEKNHLQQFGARTALIIRLQLGKQLIGYAALWESRKRREFTADEIALCQGIAQQATIAIQNARLLEQARQDADTKAILLKEVNHRVKNNLTSIIGLLYAERRHKVNAETQPTLNEIIQDLINRVHGLSTVHGLLSATEWSPLLLSELAHQVVSSTLQSLASDKQVVVEVSPSPVRVTPQQANNLALIINELTNNAFKYGLADHQPLQLTINIRQQDDMILLEFRNSGDGYPQEVLTLERHNVGIYLIQNLARKGLGGQINLRNEEGAVTTICFPVALSLKGIK